RAGRARARLGQRLGLHRPPLSGEARRAGHPAPPRRLPRPREPGLHRELVRETERTGGVAERIRDPRRRPARHRRLRRPLPPPAPLEPELPHAARGRPDLGGSTRTTKTRGLACQRRTGERGTGLRATVAQPSRARDEGHLAPLLPPPTSPRVGGGLGRVLVADARPPGPPSGPPSNRRLGPGLRAAPRRARRAGRLASRR